MLIELGALAVALTGGAWGLARRHRARLYDRQRRRIAAIRQTQAPALGLSRHGAPDFSRRVVRLHDFLPAELFARLDRTLEYLRTLKASEIDGSEGREIVRPIRGEPKKFSGINYLLQFALPNFYFHTATAYAILRHSGIEIGKTDFIGALD